MNAAVIATPKIRSARVAYIVVPMFFASLIFGLALPIGLLIWQSVTPRVAIRTGEAGVFISASGQSGFMQRELTNVQTTQGTLIVYGLFSAARGQRLEVVDVNKENAKQLCAAGDLSTCLPLATRWAGTMAPAPSATRVFNFARYGLGGGTPQAWLGIGIVACIVTFFALGLAFEDGDSRSDGESDDAKDSGA